MTGTNVDIVLVVQSRSSCCRRCHPCSPSPPVARRRSLVSTATASPHLDGPDGSVPLRPICPPPAVLRDVGVRTRSAGLRPGPRRRSWPSACLRPERLRAVGAVPLLRRERRRAPARRLRGLDTVRLGGDGRAGWCRPAMPRHGPRPAPLGLARGRFLRHRIPRGDIVGTARDPQHLRYCTARGLRGPRHAAGLGLLGSCSCVALGLANIAIEAQLLFGVFSCGRRNDRGQRPWRARPRPSSVWCSCRWCSRLRLPLPRASQVIVGGGAQRSWSPGHGSLVRHRAGAQRGRVDSPERLPHVRDPGASPHPGGGRRSSTSP
ncbi:hypothetical protein QJS66_08590 [Kocuria rhizophila]|nr:hypothetical protein QJS66_08590 [Kocuria rhizophila]